MEIKIMIYTLRSCIIIFLINQKKFFLFFSLRNVEFKFLPSNRILPAQTVQADQEVPISVAVCWNNSNQILFYPMGKVNKGY